MDRTLELIKKARDGDALAREVLVEENIGLIWSIVKRFNNRGYELEDLFQIGSIGLIKSIDKFDLSYDVKFSTYAVPMILGEIKRFLRDDGIIKVSRSLKETANKVRVTKEVLTKRYGREPTIEEVAKELEITTEDIVLAMESNAEVESLYKTIHQGDGNPIYLIDKLDQSVNNNDLMIDKIALKEVIQGLKPKEREIIMLRYFKDKTQTEIANEIGISQVQVSRLEKKILSQLKEKLS
ncbi:RNA polymerase sigma (RpoX/SigF) subunit [Natranaerovirga hydrolytica]|uniref:RNA polymerase sigma factor n=1 Tax=Natranaerovirga hydrolytica TaxID=680378 RepID=A0A4R1MKT9_9FIRM|nr:RNA polymerase sporulation sigma factor SigF [Natranaerovirga hydrolytica]TCK92442.1 RNA polymerase sigma (RpoX/SigF) subunit [Natranaerovirga hydrolytica]